jgi:hypothetical protein
MLRGLTTNFAETARAHRDARLRGRTYAIPFEDVWNAAHALAAGALPRWHIAAADDEDGVIRAEAVTLVRRKCDDIVIRVTLDENGQTRVDARAGAREGHGDWGRNARRLDRFFRALDDAVVQQNRMRMAKRGGKPPAPSTASSSGATRG